MQLSPSGNALATADAVRKRMGELAPYFPAGMKWDIPYDSSRFVRISISQVVETLLEAVALSTILIAGLLFLATWALLGRPFVASEVFTGLSLVIIGRIPLIQVQLFAQYAGEARSSFGRVGDVLLLPALAPSAVQVRNSASCSECVCDCPFVLSSCQTVVSLRLPSEART